MRGYNRQHGIRQFLLNISRFLPKSVMVDYGLKQVYRFRNENSEYVCHFLGKAVYKKGIYQKKWFEHPQKVGFEKVELYAPNHLHEFLTERFGDYMTPPSAERIKWEQHAYKWDVERDFSYYSNKDRNFDDEVKLA